MEWVCTASDLERRKRDADNFSAKYWSDSHVSEDFDQALRLQIAGFIIRLASYHHGEFKEGVSLTVFDELARWQKYTYGCNELLFNPLIKWPYRGPFTPILWRLLFSNIKSSSKVTILGYVFTYYAMAAALPFCIINYLLTGLIPDSLDHYYLDSFRIMVLLLVVFNLLVRSLTTSLISDTRRLIFYSPQ